MLFPFNTDNGIIKYIWMKKGKLKKEINEHEVDDIQWSAKLKNDEKEYVQLR